VEPVGARVDIVSETAKLGGWPSSILSYYLWINRIAWPIEAVGSGFIAYWACFETPGGSWGTLLSGGVFAAFAVISAICTLIWWGPPESD
jgi:hypothetical protein